MSNYAAVAARAAEWLARPLAVCGWSMGGLAAMMAAERIAPNRLVLLEPSPPAETQGLDQRVRPQPGTYEGEVVYGAFPPGIRSRRESAFARDERKRGRSVPSLPRSTLVLYGDEFTDERGRAIAAYYRTEERYLPGLDHWGLVLDQRGRDAVAEYLYADAARSASPSRM